MRQRLEEASPDGLFTMKLKKSSDGLGRTSYDIIGGSLGELLATEYWQGVRLAHKPWHVSL